MRRIVFLDLKQAPVADLGCGGPEGRRVFCRRKICSSLGRRLT